MEFEKDRTTEKTAAKAGFILSYFLFTTILFFILMFLGKLPDSWSYIHIMIITLGIVIMGKIIEWLLK